MISRQIYRFLPLHWLVVHSFFLVEQSNQFLYYVVVSSYRPQSSRFLMHAVVPFHPSPPKHWYYMYIWISSHHPIDIRTSKYCNGPQIHVIVPWLSWLSPHLISVHGSRQHVRSLYNRCPKWIVTYEVYAKVNVAVWYPCRCSFLCLAIILSIRIYSPRWLLCIYIGDDWLLLYISHTYSLSLSLKSVPNRTTWYIE